MPVPKTTVNSVFDEALGNFAVSDHSERVYAQVYYAIRERQGMLSRKRNGEDFSWDDFKQKFTEAFGTPNNPTYTIEQLLDYALRKFNMTLQDLIDANKRSWERRRAWEEKYGSYNSIPQDWNPG
ncbi:MAG: hypothetical protein GPI95_17510 [Microcystis aeruginosa LG13-11]|jgi:hypothetical protein|nr:hypothetical protein [Microcystis aeruginosa LG13-11]